MAEQSITDLLDQVIARYQPGGDYGKAALGTLETRKKKTLASQQQSLVSSGLSGTTRGASLGKKFEEDIGTPTRLGIEETRVGALTQAMQAKAGFMERDQARQDQLMRDAYERLAQQQQAQREANEAVRTRSAANEASSSQWMQEFMNRGSTGGSTGSTAGFSYDGRTQQSATDPWGGYQGDGGTPGSTQEAVQNLSIGYGPMFGDTAEQEGPPEPTSQQTQEQLEIVGAPTSARASISFTKWKKYNFKGTEPAANDIAGWNALFAQWRAYTPGGGAQTSTSGMSQLSMAMGS